MGMEVVGTLALSGVLSALSVFIFAMFIGIHKVVGYHLWVDAVFSVILVVVYAGTFSGMITAFTGGLALSLMLFLTKKSIGYGRWTRNGWRYYPGWFTECVEKEGTQTTSLISRQTGG